GCREHGGWRWWVVATGGASVSEVAGAGVPPSAEGGDGLCRPLERPEVPGRAEGDVDAVDPCSNVAAQHLGDVPDAPSDDGVGPEGIGARPELGLERGVVVAHDDVDPESDLAGIAAQVRAVGI